MKRGAALVLVLGGALACGLGPLEVAGLSCTDTRGCGPGFQCFEGRCFREGQLPDAGVDAGLDAGPDAGEPDAGEVDAGEPDAGVDAGFDAGIPRGVNLLNNPDFERLTSDGGTVGWRASTGRVLPAHDAGLLDSRALRLQSTGTQQQMTLIPNVDVEGPELGMLFCASVWLRAESDAGVDVTLYVRDRFFDGGTSTTNGTRITVKTGWVQVKEEFATLGTSTIQFRLTTNARFDAGDGIFVDDAWLSRGDGSGCPP